LNLLTLIPYAILPPSGLDPPKRCDEDDDLGDYEKQDGRNRRH
jgi:hypothetical protein